MMNLDGPEYKHLVELAKQSYDGHGLINSQMPDQLTRQARAFAEAIVKECSAAAKKWQGWNERCELQVNIDQIILSDFGMMK